MKTVKVLGCLATLLMIAMITASLCSAQYITDYQLGQVDAHSLLPTKNAWVAMATSSCVVDGLKIAQDGTILCLTSTGSVLSFDITTRTWNSAKYAGMGSGIFGIAPLDEDHVYVLGNGGLQQALCQNGTHSVKVWTGSGYTPLNGCGSQLSVGQDGALAVESMIAGAVYRSTDGGMNWTAISGSPVSGAANIYYVSANNANSMCGVGSTKIFRYGAMNHQFEAVPVQPTTSGIVGCAFAGNVLIAWSSTWIKQYDSSTGAWASIIGLAQTRGVTTWEDGYTFALSSTGQAYHLNVYPGMISGTTSGSTTGCPPNNAPCPIGTHHDLSIQVTMPGGIGPGHASPTTQSVPPTTVGSVTSFDYSFACDPVYGFQQSSCTPTATGTIKCSATGLNYAGGAGSKTPPTFRGLSLYYAIWDQTVPAAAAVPIPGDQFMWAAAVACGAKRNACRPGTQAFCVPPGSSNGPIVAIYAEEVQASSRQGAIDTMSLNCAAHAGGPPLYRGWEILYLYDIKTGVNSCKQQIAKPVSHKVPGNCV